MPRLRGLHHLAFSTTDMKGQIAFFSEVLGMRLTALFWMHGVPGAWHGFLELDDNASVAFVAMPDNAKGKSELGSSHAPHGGGPSAPGTMQHVAFNVESMDDLIAFRNRIRQNGVPVFGPVDHGFCQSIYFAGPEGLNLEISTSVNPPDPDEWIDPEVVALAGISAEELAAFRNPPAGPGARPETPQPAFDPARPHLKYPPPVYEKLLEMPDAVYMARASYNEPPVRKVAADPAE